MNVIDVFFMVIPYLTIFVAGIIIGSIFGGRE